MKALIAAVAATMIALAGSSPRADAGLEISIGFGKIYVSGHASCGCPIYSRRVCRGFDSHRRPIFASYRQPFQCRCKGHSKSAKDARKYYEKREKEYRKQQKDYGKHFKKAHKKHK